MAPNVLQLSIDTAEYHGSVSGKTLLEWGMDPTQVPDPEQEYRVTAWLIDRFVIKTQLDPTPSQRAPYYVSQFEKIPGTMYGYGLPDLLEDIQTVANASYRSLVNNMGIASGPQVVINDAVLAPGEDDSMYPWKRWHVSYDPMMASAGMQPIMFYQPDSRAQEIQGLIANLNLMADDVSAIPRYMTGGAQGGGAGRTASGLSMLMSNAAKTLQNVAASIDRDVFEPMLKHLYETIMLTMPGVFRGDESVVVKGVVYAVKREQDRTRQLEFLNMTANPTDMQIVGISGRSKVLGAVANSIGLDWDNIVPDDASMEAAQAQQQQEQAARAAGARDADGGSGAGQDARSAGTREFVRSAGAARRAAPRNSGAAHSLSATAAGAAAESVARRSDTAAEPAWDVARRHACRTEAESEGQPDDGTVEWNPAAVCTAAGNEPRSLTCRKSTRSARTIKWSRNRSTTSTPLVRRPRRARGSLRRRWARRRDGPRTAAVIAAAAWMA